MSGDCVNAEFWGSGDAGSISGDNFDVQVIPHDLLRPLQSTLPSGPWLFPAAEIWGEQVIPSPLSQARSLFWAFIFRVFLFLFLFFFCLRILYVWTSRP